MTDNISVSLVEKLVPYLGDTSKNAPARFLLELGACRSSAGIQFVGQVLKPNRTISWLTTKFNQSRPVSIESMKGIYHFVAASSSLKVLEVITFSARDNNGGSEEIGRLLLKAAAKNNNIERILLRGWVCKYVAEVAASNICELEVDDIPTSIAHAWPLSLPIDTLRLRPKWNDRKQRYVSEILDKLADSNKDGSNVQHLHIKEWSWSLPTFLRSRNSAIETLHLLKVDFRHDEVSGCSAMDGLLLGLLGSKTTKSVSFWMCKFDQKATNKFLREIQSGALALEGLSFEFDSDDMCDEMLQVWSCDTIQQVAFDCEDTDKIDTNLDIVKERLLTGTISSVRIGTQCLAQLGPALKHASTVGSLTKLELPWAMRSQADVDCLVKVLRDDRCQLKHLCLGFWDDFASTVISTLTKQSRLESLCLVAHDDEQLKCIIHAWEGLKKIESLTRLTLPVVDTTKLTVELEEKLGEVADGNWSLENIILFELSCCCGLQCCGLRCDYHEPIITSALQRKLDALIQRNKARKTIQKSENLVQHQARGKKYLVDKLGRYSNLPNGESLAFWLLQKMPGSFF